jgi:hypothetical protein
LEIKQFFGGGSMKKTVCSMIRVITMAVALFTLQQLYNIGLAGVIAVGVTGIVWAVTTDVEHDP